MNLAASEFPGLFLFCVTKDKNMGYYVSSHQDTKAVGGTSIYMAVFRRNIRSLK